MRCEIHKVAKDVRVCVEENITSDALEGLGDVETLAFNQLVMSKIADGVQQVSMAAAPWKLEGRSLPLDEDSWVALRDTNEPFANPLAVPIDVQQIYVTDEDETTYEEGITVQTKAMDDLDAVIIGRDGDSSLMSISAAGINWFSSDGRKGGWFYLPKDFMRLLVFEMSDWSVPVFDPITPEHPLYIQQRSPFSGVRGSADKPVVAVVPKTGGKALEFYSCRTADAKVVTASYLPIPEIIGNMIEISKPIYKAAIYNIASLVAMSRGEEQFAQNLSSVAQNLIQ